MKDFSMKLEGPFLFYKTKKQLWSLGGPGSLCDTTAPLGWEEITSHTFSK